MNKTFLSGLAAGIAMVLANAALNPLFEAVFPGLAKSYEGNPAFRPWQDPVMMLFFLYPVALGFGLAWVWSRTKHLFLSGGVLKKGFNFGMIYFAVLGVPTFLINYSSFTFPLAMVASWTIMGLVDGMVAGMVLARLNK